MSEARQPPVPVLPWSGASLGLALIHGGMRLFRIVALMALGAALLAGLGAAGLAWRLSQGPLDVTRLAQWGLARKAGGAPVSVQAASLAWAGFEQGAGRALDIRLEGMRFDAPGGMSAAVAEAELELSMAGLLAGEVSPRSLVVNDATLNLVWDSAGQVTLGRGQGRAAEDGADFPSSPDEILTQLRRPLDGAGPPLLRQLRHLAINNLSVMVTDARWGTARLAGKLDLRRVAEGGVTGAGSAIVTAGQAEAAVAVTAALGEHGGTQLAVTLSPVDLAALSKVSAPLAPLGRVTASVGLRIAATLSPALLPQTVAIEASAGGGRLEAPGASLPFESLALDAAATWDSAPARLPVRLEIRRAQAVVASPGGGWPSTAVVQGAVTRSGTTLRGAGAVTLDHLAFADLGRVWPAAWGGHARPWLVENITAGTARNARAEATMAANDDGTGFKVEAFAASLLGDDVTVSWLRPVPPVEHVQARLTMTTLDTIEIALPQGRQGALVAQNGLVRITGLTVKDQDLSIVADVGGPVPDLLTLLKHPRLGMLDKHPIPVRNPAGTLTGRLTVTLPLEHDLVFEQVGIHAEGRLSGLRLGGIVAKRDLDRGEIQVDVTQDALKAGGTATVAGIAGQVAVEMDFRSGPATQIVQRASLAGRATPRQMAAAGLDPGKLMPGGSAGLTAEYSQTRAGRGEVRVQADLKEAALALAGWKKASGQPAQAQARLAVQQDRLQGIEAFSAEGPGMQVSGRAEMVGDMPSRLVLDRIWLGPTRAQGQIDLPRAPADPVVVRLSGSVLDLSTELGGGPSRKAEPAAEASTPFVGDIRFDRVMLGGGRSAGSVVAHAEHDGKRLTTLRLQTSGPERVQATLLPTAGGRHLSLRAADGGAMLRALDVTGSVVGGALAVEGDFDDRQAVPPLSGTIDLTEFHVRDAPAVGKLLQALTIYGLGEAMSGPGLKFTRLNAPFVWNGATLYLGESQAFSASLGLTAKGEIRVPQGTLDVTGTIVPVYALNSALGRLPVLGRLFSPERGGGLLALTYGLHGRVADPSVAVNPLSALTPGLLRRLFRVFE